MTLDRQTIIVQLLHSLLQEEVIQVVYSDGGGWMRP